MFGHRRRLVLISGLLLAAAAVTGCGQKGPLYLYQAPEQQPQNQAETEGQPQEEELQQVDKKEVGPTLQSEPGRLTPSP